MTELDKLIALAESGNILNFNLALVTATGMNIDIKPIVRAYCKNGFDNKFVSGCSFNNANAENQWYGYIRFLFYIVTAENNESYRTIRIFINFNNNKEELGSQMHYSLDSESEFYDSISNIDSNITNDVDRTKWDWSEIEPRVLDYAVEQIIKLFKHKKII